MNRSTLHRRSLVYHARSHSIVALAVAVGCAVLTGALLVGDSMRGSLRDLALRRLGPVDAALVSPRFFRAALADGGLVPDAAPRTMDTTQMAIVRGDKHKALPKASPLIISSAALVHAESKARINTVNLFGVGNDFWWFYPDEIAKQPRFPSDSALVLNEALAAELGADVGDDVLIYMENRQLVPAETLLGRRDELGTSTRLKVTAVIHDQGWGALDLSAAARQPLNAFVSIATLQRITKRPGQANAILIGAASEVSVPAVNDRLRGRMQLADYDLSLRPDEQLGYVALETKRLLLEPPIEDAALAAARAQKLRAEPILTYLVNSITRKDSPPDGPLTPYSVATAIGSTQGMTLIDGSPAPEPGDDEVLINSWTADDLSAKPGDTLILKYYISKPFGKLEVATAELKIAGIVRIEGLAADRGMTPEYEGITNTDRLSEWNPPFPMDMTSIRPKDEEYWKQHRGTPKLFVSLKTGERLWAESDPRFGRYTAIRLYPSSGGDLSAVARAFEGALLERIDPAQLGLRFEPVRARALAAASGNTDFGMLFIGFSMFLIVAAMLLVALVFRLGIERRSDEIGLLLAEGFNRRQVTRLMLGEGLLIAVAGTGLGLAAAAGYAKLMLAGLRAWNRAQDVFPPLELHVPPRTLIIGGGVSFILALLAIVWSIRGLTRQSVRNLLARVAAGASGLRFGGGWRYRIVAAMCIVIAAVLCGSVWTGASEAPAFFGAGTLLLIAGLCLVRAWMASPAGRAVRPGGRAIARLGVANARRNPGRSMLTTALIACATFVIIAVGANRQNVSVIDFARGGGLGGFRLFAQSVVPIAYDLDSAAGRESAGLSSGAAQMLRGSSIQSFRVQPGDDASCLNLYQVTRPRILGATEPTIRRGGFSFSSHLARSSEEKLNPWILLEDQQADHAIPAIGDANTVKWLLHLGLGDDLTITDERGVQRKLRIVALLSRSMLQGELIISEDNFKRLFPSVSGYAFFLIDVPSERAGQIETVLERSLSDYGLDVSDSSRRLAGFLAIENMYLSTFQLLGGLGLVLGTIGLSVVMLRNIYERRGEFALLRALGLPRIALGRMVLNENLALLTGGLLIGAVSAAAAVSPHLVSQPGTIPWTSLAATILAVLAFGLLAGLAAVIGAMRTPLLAALRAE